MLVFIRLKIGEKNYINIILETLAEVMPLELARKKEFYDKHLNFTDRTLIDYNISPGTMAKFDIIKKRISNFNNSHSNIKIKNPTKIKKQKRFFKKGAK